METLERQSKQDEQRFNQAAKRTARRLVSEHGITKRRLGSGRKQELDSEGMNLFFIRITELNAEIF